MNAKIAKPDVVFVSATKLGEHLDLSRQRIASLVSEGVIERRPDGRFNLDGNRVAYIRWLRSPERRSVRSEAASEFQREKARFLALKIAQLEGRLIEYAEAEAAIDFLMGTVLSELGSLPVRVTRDLTLRQVIETEVLAIRHRLADAADAKRAAVTAEGAHDGK